LALRDFADRNTEFLEIDCGSANHTVKIPITSQSLRNTKPPKCRTISVSERGLQLAVN